MGVKDLIITPFFLVFLYFLAYLIRPFVTNSLTRKYFIPALTLKFIGAVTLGLIYQFYYQGGDTFNFWEHGSRWIWEAFMNEPMKGVKLMLANGRHYPETYEYSQYIWHTRDKASYFIVKIAALFDLFTFHTYSSTALLFASTSFSGLWALYTVLQRLYPSLGRNLAYAIFFIPSVFLWGSGILKDSITLGALGWITFALLNMFLIKKGGIRNVFLLIFFSWVIYSIKIYILLCFIMGTVAFLYAKYLSQIKASLSKLILTPFILLIVIGFGYLTLNKISEKDPRYALEKIAETARVTAYDIRFGTGKDAGSGYTLGQLDGSFGSLLLLAPSAINVSLFRPYLWEVNSILMLIAALESICLLAFTVIMLLKSKISIILLSKSPVILFCLTFSLIFAFAVGTSTFNFGSLVRYKIPLIPFYITGLVLIRESNRSILKLNSMT